MSGIHLTRICEVWRVKKSLWTLKIRILPAEPVQIRENRVWGVTDFFYIGKCMKLTRFSGIFDHVGQVRDLDGLLLVGETLETRADPVLSFCWMRLICTFLVLGRREIH